MKDRPEAPDMGEGTAENWWDLCPICGSELANQKCRFVCSNPQCQFFMSCSEFDL